MNIPPRFRALADRVIAGDAAARLELLGEMREEGHPFAEQAAGLTPEDLAKAVAAALALHAPEQTLDGAVARLLEDVDQLVVAVRAAGETAGTLASVIQVCAVVRGALIFLAGARGGTP